MEEQFYIIGKILQGPIERIILYSLHTHLGSRPDSRSASRRSAACRRGPTSRRSCAPTCAGCRPAPFPWDRRLGDRGWCALRGCPHPRRSRSQSCLGSQTHRL